MCIRDSTSAGCVRYFSSVVSCVAEAARKSSEGLSLIHIFPGNTCIENTPKEAARMLLAAAMVVMSLIAFFAMGADKLKAKRGAWRIPERV